MTERVIRSGGVRLWSESAGDPADPVLLLVAGDATSAFGWPDEFVSLLVDGGLRVLRYDHRDTGRSAHRDFAAHPYGFDDLAADAVAVLDGWGAESAHLLGMGLGGGLGQLIAVAEPDRLRSLTLLATHGLGVDFAGNWALARAGEPSGTGFPTPRPWFVRGAEEPSRAVDAETALAERVEWHRLCSGDGLPFDAAEFRRWESRDDEHTGTWRRPAVHPHGFMPHVLAERGDDLAKISTPTLVVQAPLDPINPPPHGKLLAEAISGARYAEIDGMGYALPNAAHRPLVDRVLDQVRLAGLH
ncbi:alpha/beta fold hydrolase [Saccharopolyspora sp. NFXS83]|uniref:alpha/beta fold hydrolase n=1 Tax=Saccharopolyspora sp. NFXS83 TaxID=2993560 RepID=UPI00224B6225|nr:alpha/beta fold hydrolase [Saccharopolyspora sp. NFXS83]MCX2733588.1 alpha/beta fold hydrolase [Saccharopolyspora sp. NFXS83]